MQNIQILQEPHSILSQAPEQELYPAHSLEDLENDDQQTRTETDDQYENDVQKPEIFEVEHISPQLYIYLLVFHCY